MYYVYVLWSIKKTKRFYTGSTSDLRQRFREHNEGIGGIFSSKNRPYKLLYYEAFLLKTDVLEQELFYKTGYGREVLKGKLANSLTKLGV